MTMCPCCGNSFPQSDACACGARRVGSPQTDPVATVPRLGPAMFALTLGLAGGLCYFSKFFVGVAVLGLYVSLKALRAIQRDGANFGGLRMARAGAAISALTILTVGTLVGFDIPKWLWARQERQAAISRVRMYEMELAVREYQRRHGSLPADLEDLRREGLFGGSTRDFWGKSIRYEPTGKLAATSVGTGGRAAVPVFSTYRLVSAGPDGVLNTKDDLVFVNNLFVSPEKAKTLGDDGDRE